MVSIRPFLIGVVLICGLFSTLAHDDGVRHVFMESQAPLSLRHDLVRHTRALSDATHHVIFVIKERNTDELDRLFYDVSNPHSDNYGKYWTSDQIANLTANLPARDALLTYLSSAGVEMVSQTLHGEMVTVRGKVHQFERIFKTEFYNYHRVLGGSPLSTPESQMGPMSASSPFSSALPSNATNTEGRRQLSERAYIRAEQYSIPTELHAHVFTVLNTVQLPLPTPQQPELIPMSASGLDVQIKHEGRGGFSAQATVPLVSGTIDPNIINRAYNVDSNQASASATQCVFGAIEQNFSPADLNQFQTYYSIPKQAVASTIGNHNLDSMCKSNPNNCIEGNMDVQYLMATARSATTTWWYTDDQSFADFFTNVYNTPNPPLVFTISYSTDEAYLSTSSYSEIKVFDSVAKKLAVMGVTIVAASGDNGVMTSNVAKPSPVCTSGYRPQFPASSAYVLAVGATQGVESGTTEIVCQSNQGGVISSGGGFSNYYSTPAWQASLVSAYVSSAAGKSAVAGYSTGRRGYPDVSLTAVNYQYFVGGQLYKASGTSASCPVMAGFITLVNAARFAVGKPALGFVNPLLYDSASYPKFVNDVTSGKNQCYSGSSNVLCCSQGFDATTGWDPATGLGSVNFQNFKLVMLGQTPTTAAPSDTPITTNLYTVRVHG